MNAKKFDVLMLEAEAAFTEMWEEFEEQWEGERAWQQTNMSSSEEIPGKQLPTNLAKMPVS